MASKQQTLDFVLEQLSLDGVTSRKMFGEYAIYYRERVVALFCDDRLFIKPTNAGRELIGRVSEAPPYPGAKPWYFISGDRCEDGEWLTELVRVTADELPPPKPKTSKAKRRSRASKPDPQSTSSPVRRTRPKPQQATAESKHNAPTKAASGRRVTAGRAGAKKATGAPRRSS